MHKPPQPSETARRVRTALPGSRGEHLLQRAHGTQERARRFYADQVTDRLTDEMVEFVGRMETVFIATADERGECDASLRAGPAGFVHVLDDQCLVYPEYRGNGVMASLGNISGNPHIGLLMVDFVRDRIGLHINGKARVIEDADLRAVADLPRDSVKGRRPERWVMVQVEEAYVHCRKHIPRMARLPSQRAWGTDDVKQKGSDYFRVEAGSKPSVSKLERSTSLEEPRPRNHFAIAGLVLGLVALLLSWTIIGGVIFGILALTFGLRGRSRAKRGQAARGGVAGVALGIAGLLIAAGMATFVAMSILNSPAGRTYQKCVTDSVRNPVTFPQCFVNLDQNVRAAPR